MFVNHRNRSYMEIVVDNSGYPLTSGIGFHKEGRNLVLTLSKRSLVSNMQSDEGAFEGWTLCLFANNPGIYEKIIIQWNPIERFDKEGIITDAERGHYYRFLYRAYKFQENYPSIVEIQPAVSSVFDVDEFKDWVLNYPNGESHESQKSNKNAEAHLERELLEIMQGAFDYCDHQLPAGLFFKDVSKKTARCSGGLGQIDLWSVCNGSLNIYELKNDVNLSVGIISELMFYTNVMNDFRMHRFNYPAEFVRKRKFYRHSKELYDSISKDEISHVNGILLANNLHPRITGRVIDLMNQNAAQITYSKQTVNDFISLLSR